MRASGFSFVTTLSGFIFGSGCMLSVLSVSGAGFAQAPAVPVSSAPATAPATTAVPAVTAEKRASAQDVATKAYSRVEFRHGVQFGMEKADLKNVTPRAEARATIGTRLADDRLDLSVTFGAIKNNDKAVFEQRNPEIVAELNAASGSNYSITPYMDLYTPFAGKGTEGITAVNAAVKTREYSVRGGTWSLSASVEPGFETASRAGMAPVDNKAGRPGSEFGLVYNEETKAEETTKREPNMINETVAAVTFKPAALAGVTASLGAFVDTEWQPKYEAVLADDGANVAVRKSGYGVTNNSFSRFRVSYAVSDRVLFINDTYHFVDGIYESRTSGTRWENIARLSYTMF